MGVVVAVGDDVADGFLLVCGEGVELFVPVVLVFGEGVLGFPDGGVVEGGGVEGCCDATQGAGHGCFLPLVVVFTGEQPLLYHM